MELQQPPLYEPLAPYVRCQVLTWKPKLRLTYGPLDVVMPRRKLIEQLNRWRPDVLHIHGEFLPSNIWVRRAISCPSILTPHGVFHPALFDSMNRKPCLRRNLYLRIATLLFYRRLEAFHALSPVEEHQIRKILPSANVYYLPEGPSVQMEALLTSQNKDEIRRISEYRKLIFVGRLDIHTKGLDILLSAFAEAIQLLQSRNISLILAGPDWRGGLAVLQDTARRLRISDRVKFTGSCSSTVLAKLLAEADIFVLLSRREGFSLSLAEALIAGKPSIVSSEVGSLAYKEVASLPYVYSVKPEIGEAAEAIAYTVLHLEELRRLAKKEARQAKEFFDWQRIASLHARCYSGLLNGSTVPNHERAAHQD